jgi:ferredoxin
MQVVVDAMLCDGHALCQAVAPALFVMGTDEKAHVADVEITENMLPSIHEAIAICPCRAIELSVGDA